MIHKRIMQRDLVIHVYGPVMVGDYGFTVKHELSQACHASLFDSISNGIGTMKTFKIAQEMGSFAASEIWKFATSYKNQQEYFQQILQLTEAINNKLKKSK